MQNHKDTIVEIDGKFVVRSGFKWAVMNDQKQFHCSVDQITINIPFQ